MWTIVRKEVILELVDGAPVKKLVETVTQSRHNVLYLALEESTRLNESCPSNVAYVAEPERN